MKKIFLFSVLLIIACGQAEATCNIRDIAKRVNFNIPSNIKVSTGPTIPVESMLYTKLMGIGGSAPVFTCDNSSKNRYATVITANEVPGMTSTMGKPVYETGIPDTGCRISDLLIGSVYGMIPAVAGSIPVPGTTENILYHYWLIKTGTIDLSQSPTNSSVSFYVASSDYKATMPSSLLLSINMKFINPIPRGNSCKITSTKIVDLPRIDKVTLLSTSPGGKTSKERSFTLSINYEQKSTGNTIYYWFSPHSGTDDAPGVLLNSNSTSSGGTQNVSATIKENDIPVNFYDYKAKSFIVDANKLSREINLTVDYYRTTDDITTGTVKGLLEIVIQKK